MISRLGETGAGRGDLRTGPAPPVDYSTLSDCSGSEITEISRERGIDFATALLYDRVLVCPMNRTFFEQVNSCRRSNVSEPPAVGIIPGAFYREHHNTGADGSQFGAILESINCKAELVPVESFGSLTTNAAIIADWLSRHSEERLALISLSKGSADLKIALGLPNAFELFRNVHTWLSVSGLPQGTPLAGWLGRQFWRRLGVRLLLRLRGQRYSVVE